MILIRCADNIVRSQIALVQSLIAFSVSRALSIVPAILLSVTQPSWPVASTSLGDAPTPLAAPCTRSLDATIFFDVHTILQAGASSFSDVGRKVSV